MEKIQIDPKAAKELLGYWAQEAAKNKGKVSREEWLSAYSRYEFTHLNYWLRRQLKATAAMFKRMQAAKGGENPNGGR